MRIPGRKCRKKERHLTVRLLKYYQSKLVYFIIIIYFFFFVHRFLSDRSGTSMHQIDFHSLRLSGRLGRTYGELHPRGVKQITIFFQELSCFTGNEMREIGYGIRLHTSYHSIPIRITHVFAAYSTL